MAYITSVERIGFERGLQEGRQKGEKVFLQRLLTGKFGTLPENVSSAVNALDAAEVESLGIAFLNFSSIKDLEDWLVKH